MEREKLIELRWLMKARIEEKYHEKMYENEKNFYLTEIDLIEKEIEEKENR